MERLICCRCQFEVSKASRLCATCGTNLTQQPPTKVEYQRETLEDVIKRQAENLRNDWWAFIVKAGPVVQSKKLALLEQLRAARAELPILAGKAKRAVRKVKALLLYSRVHERQAK